MRVDVDVRVQAHPARADLAEPLARQVSGHVMYDFGHVEFPSPWRGYRACLQAGLATDATHVLVIQDDATVCNDFAALLCRAVCSRPDRVLALWHGGVPNENLYAIQMAYGEGRAWASLVSQRWHPVIALVWPRRVIAPALAWVDAQNYPEIFRADDEIVGRALRALDEPVLACVPSLVQHADIVESTVGQKAWGGVDAGRVAAYWHPDFPEHVDWDAGDW